jgi:hypothetical protein
MAKRPLKEVAKEYAAEVLVTHVKRLKNEAVVEVLTRQHGRAFPVAANDGTRPTVCRAIQEHMRSALNAREGERRYEELCASGVKQPRPDVPELCSKPTACAVLPSLARMRTRFPSDALALLRDGAQRMPLLHEDEVVMLTTQLATHAHEKPARALMASQGNGREGVYATLATPLPPLLQLVLMATEGWIDSHAGGLKKGLGKKALLLRYGLGGINFAHHDSCGDFQASRAVLWTHAHSDHAARNLASRESASRESAARCLCTR